MLRSLLYAAEKFPDTWFDAIPGNFYKDKSRSIIPGRGEHGHEEIARDTHKHRVDRNLQHIPNDEFEYRHWSDHSVQHERPWEREQSHGRNYDTTDRHRPYNDQHFRRDGHLSRTYSSSPPRSSCGRLPDHRGQALHPYHSSQREQISPAQLDSVTRKHDHPVKGPSSSSRSSRDHSRSSNDSMRAQKDWSTRTPSSASESRNSQDSQTEARYEPEPSQSRWRSGQRSSSRQCHVDQTRRSENRPRDRPIRRSSMKSSSSSRQTYSTSTASSPRTYVSRSSATPSNASRQPR